MKFGALPMYELAPMKTAPAEIAVSVAAIGPIKAAASPPARLKKTRYVGALSRKLDSTPVSQKYMVLSGAPPGPVTIATSGASAPLLPACRIASTGMMVMKMPANSLATSSIGPQS